jgi:hypothetical protein
MLVVHHLDDSRSQRILWLLEELGLPSEIRHHKRDPKTRLAPPELKDIHPLGKSPVVEDDGRVIAESGAIIDYVLRKYGAGRLAPAPSDADCENYVHWMHYAEGSGMPQAGHYNHQSAGLFAAGDVADGVLRPLAPLMDVSTTSLNLSATVNRKRCQRVCRASSESIDRYVSRPNDVSPSHALGCDKTQRRIGVHDFGLNT